jgi:hypothetical protein
MPPWREEAFYTIVCDGELLARSVNVNSCREPKKEDARPRAAFGCRIAAGRRSFPLRFKQFQLRQRFDKVPLQKPNQL